MGHQLFHIATVILKIENLENVWGNNVKKPLFPYCHSEFLRR